MDGDAAHLARLGVLATHRGGRALCFILSLYGFAVFGYVTAALATFFVGWDAEDEEAELAGAKSLEALRAEVAALRVNIRSLREARGYGGGVTGDLKCTRVSPPL